MKTDVLVVGEGVLADHVHGDLSGQYQVNRQTDFEAGIPQTTAMVLLLQDAWNPAVHLKAEEVIRTSRHSMAAGVRIIWRGSGRSVGAPGCSWLLTVCRPKASHGRA